MLGLAACSSINNYVPSFVKPYRADVQQGNWLTQEQVALLRPGMTREQVRFALGSPTLTSIFHADRWDYPYLFTPGHGKTEERRFTVYFVNDRLDRWTGDEQPAHQPFQQKDPGKSAEPTAPVSAPAASAPAANVSQPVPPATTAAPSPAPAPAAAPAPGTPANTTNHAPLTIDGNAAPTALDPGAPPAAMPAPAAPPAADTAPAPSTDTNKE
nr:outer membrane protein assembly factor BamE [Pigmentiphaga sp.]